ncbi:MAG: hypothetical protein OEY59_02665 [Deltaproteobacteria bacterium]|nr:hypothetical protein [Deltaproteobacteria bacterium]
MDRKIKIKNPGCNFCRYFLKPFTLDGKKTPEACLKGARKMYQQKKTDDGKKYWKWSDCSSSKEKNKARLCPDFQIESFVHTVSAQLSSKIKNAGQQLPPTFKKDKWWKT